ncbi:MAG: hypothetical protein N3D82_02730 [Ignisphaera sp.]|nr:hypothetical protein [Ignisphaera sp.]MCX8167934.1 hypothetical protein [Ignisphaera sp.]MDW8086249.1 hypothetical protein [Ignisphaera sp.]
MSGRKRRVVRTPEGFEVDASSGEVLEDLPLDSGYGALHLSNLAGAYSTDSPSDVCRDEDSLSRVLDRILPGLVSVLRDLLIKALCSSGSPSGLDVVRRVVEARLSMSVGDAAAYDSGGFVGLVVYRCLKSAGCDENLLLEALRGLDGGADEGVRKLVEELRSSITQSFDNVLVRWVSRPSDAIDMEFASRVLQVPVKKARRALQIVTKIDGLGVQITSRKIDVSSRAGDREKVLNVLNRLSRRLGVELSAPQPMVATVVVKLPFEVDLENLRRFGNAVRQGVRMKLEGSYWTVLVFRRTVNIYVDLQGNLERYRSALAEALPSICRFVKLVQ